MGLEKFADLKRGLGKKDGVVFLRGTDTPMHTMSWKTFSRKHDGKTRPIYLTFNLKKSYLMLS